MNSNDQTSLFSALSKAIEILDRNRTPDPDFIAAYDTLKQSRAMLTQALSSSRLPFSLREELAAA